MLYASSATTIWVMKVNAMPPGSPAPPQNSRIVGCVLAGGRASRMGGGDKALLELDGRALLSHVLERLGGQVSTIVLNANGDPGRFKAFAVPVVADAIEGFAGPLAGLLAGLRWAANEAPGATHVLTVTGDAPFVPSDLAARLSASLAQAPDACAVAASGGHVHPVIGLWPLGLAADLEREIKAGMRAANAWRAHCGAAIVAFDPATIGGRLIDPFFNANTPLELATARLIAQRQTWHAPVVGIAGWKNSGKTTLAARLAAELTARGRRISTIKFSHHDEPSSWDDNANARDTDRHAAAGAHQVVFASPARWKFVKGGGEDWHASGDDRDSALTAIVTVMVPVDLILVEGFKSAAIPKIEVRRRGVRDARPLAPLDTYVFAIAADQPVEAEGRWVTSLDDIAAIANLLEHVSGLGRGRGGMASP